MTSDELDKAIIANRPIRRDIGYNRQYVIDKNGSTTVHKDDVVVSTSYTDEQMTIDLVSFTQAELIQLIKDLASYVKTPIAVVEPDFADNERVAFYTGKSKGTVLKTVVNLFYHVKWDKDSDATYVKDELTKLDPPVDKETSGNPEND